MNNDRDDSTISALLRLGAQHDPSSIALLAPGRNPLSYDRLLAHVHSVAASLRAMGIQRNDRVAIVLPNGPEMATSFLGVACAATSAPLNPAYKTEEFEFYLSDLQAKALIVPEGEDSPSVGVAIARNIPVLRLSPRTRDEAGMFAFHGIPSAKETRFEWAGNEDVALVLHTSGTTSRPKMVPLTHANVCASARHVRGTLELTSGDRCLNVMPLFHIHGLIAALLSTLGAGASVVCPPGFSPEGFFDWMTAFHPTWYTAVPTIHQAILGQAARHRDVITQSPLRLIRSSSASLPPQVLAELEQTFGAPVIEAYGMTEAAHQMTSNPLPPRRHKPGSVGLPAGPDVAIMDAQGNLLPRGATGEVVIRGPNVTAGYAANPAANAAAFTCGWFRTGDQGTFDDDGYLSLTGRLKEIINRGGEKIAPRQIDEALLNHPAVRQTVAFAVPHPTLGEDVAAAVILHEGAVATESELRAFALAHLPAFKVPTRIVIVATIPKGPTGKIQRIGMADRLASALAVAYEPPSGPLEELAATTFGQVLEQSRIGRHDNFFALGGDSIRAMKVVARLVEALGIELPPATLFRWPTVATLALELHRVQEDGELDDLADEVRMQPDGKTSDLLHEGTKDGQ